VAVVVVDWEIVGAFVVVDCEVVGDFGGSGWGGNGVRWTGRWWGQPRWWSRR
jgi:hypothetical protein